MVLHKGDEMCLFPNLFFMEDDLDYLRCSRSQFRNLIETARNQVLELKALNFPWRDWDPDFEIEKYIKIW